MKKIRTLILVSAWICISTLSFGQDLTDNFRYYSEIEFNDQIVESRINENNGTIFQKVVIDGFDSKIPFYLIEPTDKKEVRFVILLHGVTYSKDDWINSTSQRQYSDIYVGLKDSLLTLGYSLVIPDAKYHGERSYEANFASPVTFYSSQDLQKVYNLLATTVKDIRIIMDYMQSKSNNASITFNVIGYSMGGMLTVFLNSVEDRLNRVVVCVAPLNHPKGAQMLGMNEELAHNLDILSPKNYASLQKAPVTLLMGTDDAWYTKEEAQDFFEKMNIKDKTLIFYQSGHYLPNEFISDAIESINKD